FFQAEDGIRDFHVTGVQTCALPIYSRDVFRANQESTLYRYRIFNNRGKTSLIDDFIVFVLTSSVLFTVEFNSNYISAVIFCPYRSEEHTSELQSRENLVCRLLLEKK